MCVIAVMMLILAISGSLYIYKAEVKIYKIAGEYQPADIFTKGLPRAAFQRHCCTIMGE